MNVILQQALGSVLRWLLAIGAGYLVKAGIWTDSEAVTYISAGAVAVLSIGWSLWEKYKSRQKLLTALTMPPGVTENQLKQLIKEGEPTPTVKTDPNTVPGVPKT